MKRGEIYYIERASQTGCEQIAGRPAIIVSNDRCNFNSEVVEIVYLTTAPKIDLPTHVTIRSAQKVSIALCEQVTSVSITRIGNYLATCTDAEMDEIDTALAISLDIPEYPAPAEDKASYNDTFKLELDDCKVKLANALKEKDMWEQMYYKLLDRVLK